MSRQKTFRVYAQYTSYCYVDIEAKDEAEAEEKADLMDGGDFTPDEDVNGSDWEIREDLTKRIKTKRKPICQN